MKPKRVGWLVVIGSLILISTGCAAHAQESKEQEIKAGMLYNFLLFVEWPPEAFSGAGAPIRMCVLDDEPVAATLETMTRGKQARERNIEVTRLDAPADASSCHLVFVGGSRANRFTEVLGATKGSNVLTVCDDEECVERGGIIRLFKEHNRMRIEIGPAADRTGLKIHSSLRNLAKRAPAGASGQ